jgi:hypothetical protein
MSFDNTSLTPGLKHHLHSFSSCSEIINVSSTSQTHLNNFFGNLERTQQTANHNHLKLTFFPDTDNSLTPIELLNIYSEGCRILQKIKKIKYLYSELYKKINEITCPPQLETESNEDYNKRVESYITAQEVVQKRGQTMLYRTFDHHSDQKYKELCSILKQEYYNNFSHEEHFSLDEIDFIINRMSYYLIKHTPYNYSISGRDNNSTSSFPLIFVSPTNYRIIYNLGVYENGEDQQYLKIREHEVWNLKTNVKLRTMNTDGTLINISSLEIDLTKIPDVYSV